MQMMTRADYARHRGVSRPAVTKWVKVGTIKVDEAGMINPADADFALDQGRTRVDTRPPVNDALPRESDTAGLTKARTVTEVYAARMAQLKYERAVGEVVPAVGLSEAALVCGETVVRIIGGLSTHAEECAAVSKDGISAARLFLKSMERELRAKVAEAFAKMAADATAGAPGDMETEDEIDGPSIQA